MTMTRAEITAAYRERNKEKVRAYARERYHRLRAETLALLGPTCRQCGYADERALEIDHLEPVRHRQGGKQWHAEMLNVRAHPEQYQVLCANCHAIKSKGEQGK